MVREPRYWRLSPNVMNDEQSVDSWKEVIREGYAIMGDRHGKEVWDLRFRDQVQKGDIVLVARRQDDGKSRDMFGFGCVDGPMRGPRRFSQPDRDAYYRVLKPFKLWKTGNEPHGIDLLRWPRGSALQELHPDRVATHRILCKWMKRQIEGVEQIEDELYQERARESVDPDSPDAPSKAEIVGTGGGRRLKIDHKIAAKRHKLSDYKCEMCGHVPFVSQSSKKGYVEAHHLVPANPNIQEEFGLSHPLDNIHNIVSLCANCHRLLHHAVSEQKKPWLKMLFERRENDLHDAGIGLSFDQLMEYY